MAFPCSLNHVHHLHHHHRWHEDLCIDKWLYANRACSVGILSSDQGLAASSLVIVIIVINLIIIVIVIIIIIVVPCAAVVILIQSNPPVKAVACFPRHRRICLSILKTPKLLPNNSDPSSSFPNLSHFVSIFQRIVNSDQIIEYFETIILEYQWEDYDGD